MVTDRPSQYERAHWFGPASLAGIVVGLISISLPYVGLASRDANWAILGPPAAGAVLVILSLARAPYAYVLRRTGTGLLCSFAAVLLAVPGFLLGVGISGLFT